MYFVSGPDVQDAGLREWNKLDIYPIYFDHTNLSSELHYSKLFNWRFE